MKLTLKEVHQETVDVETFIFEAEEPVSWTPGQYIKYTLPHEADNRGITRYFTIASAPSEGHIQITTRFAEKSSTFKSHLKSLQIGDTIEANPPSGNFIYPVGSSFAYPHPDKPVVFIAGGIGITPYRSILVDLDAKNIDAPIILLYANKSADNVPFKELLDELASKHSSLKVEYVIEPERITADYIRHHVPDLDTPTFYISGPEPMVEAFDKMMTDELGIPRDRIETDFFPGYEA